MSLEYCARCKKEFLTEANDYVVCPREGYALNCGCLFTDAVSKEITRLKSELERVKKIAHEVCEFYGGVRRLSGYEVALAPARCVREDLEEIFINEIGVNKTVSGKLARAKKKELEELG